MWKMSVKEILEYLKSHPKYITIIFLSLLIPSIIRRNRQALKKNLAVGGGIEVEKISFSEFLQLAEKQEIKNVILKPETLDFTLKSNNNKIFTTKPTTYHPGIVEFLHTKAIAFDEVNVVKGDGINFRQIFVFLFPIFYLGLCVYVLKKYLNPSEDAGKQSQKHKNLLKQNKNQGKMTTFDDIQGINKAKNLVTEIVSVVLNPEKYQKIGAKMPSGILLVGPPGTGKTMLAKALANEANLPFYYCSGSDFVEIYAGRGAARVRSLFLKAKSSNNGARASILFIDEIDALGKSRSNNDLGIGNNEEREQTLNQLLSCMDGFENNDGLNDSDDDDIEVKVIVIAATNRYEMLDKALTRPGRFDRVVHVNLPDKQGRVDILKVHTRKIPLEDNFDYETISTLTCGFSGAELRTLANEAALNCVREERETVGLEDFLKVLHEFKVSRGKAEINDTKTFTSSQGLMNTFLRGLSTQ